MDKQEKAPNLFKVLYSISILSVICILVVFAPDFANEEISFEGIPLFSMILTPSSISIVLFGIWGIVNYKRGKVIYYVLTFLFLLIIIAGTFLFFDFWFFAIESETRTSVWSYSEFKWQVI